MTDTIIGAIIGVGGAIIGAILAGPITYYFSKILIKITHENTIKLMQRQEFNQAAKDFIAAFHEELARLKLESISTYDIIKPALAKQMAAYYTFRGYLNSYDLESITRAWQMYLVSTPPCPEKIKDQKYQEERTALIERIETLLKFAKFK